MANLDDSDIPDSGAVFTFGRSKFGDSLANKFWVRNDEVLDIACGEEHTALVADSGRVFTFGSNDWGQLGLGNKVSQEKPCCVKDLKNRGERARLVACGRNHTLIGTASNNIYGFGCNTENQINSDDVESLVNPEPVEGLGGEQLSMLTAGGEFSGVLTVSGKVYMWGNNDEGQLGLGKDVMNCTQPTLVSFPSKVMCVAAGHYHAAAVTEDGKLYTWGEAEGGKLGLGEAVSSSQYRPQEVELPEKAKWVACGNNHTLVVSSSGQLYSFGDGASGQLGLGNARLSSEDPTLVASLEGTARVTFASAGEAHSACITDKGALYTFGEGRHGKLGMGEDNFVNQLRPFRVKRFVNFEVNKVSCGGCHTLVFAEKSPHPAANGQVDSASDLDDDPMNSISAKSIRPLRRSKLANGDSSSFRARNKRHDQQRTSQEETLSAERTLPALRVSPRPGQGLSSTLPAGKY